MDDLYVTNSAGCRAYIQAKSILNLSRAEDSPLASALGQFARQYLDPNWSKQGCDRLVLATSSQSSSRIRVQLRRILKRVRDLPPGSSLFDAAQGAQEAEVLQIVIAHLSREWQSVSGSAPGDEDLRAILTFMRVSIHDVDDEGSQAQQAVGWLRTSVLENPSAAGGVWRQLISLGVDFSVFQVGTNRQRLQERLSQLGVELVAAPSFQNDIGKLLAYSRSNIERLKRFSVIPGANGEMVKLDRSTPDALRRSLDAGSVIVTGDPGTGKSASFYELAMLTGGTRDVVLLTSDTLAVSSLGQLRVELGLEHDVVAVLQNWPGTQSGYLIIDALDAARGERTQQTLLDLIGSAANTAERWRIAASVRRFDLRYNLNLQSLFATTGTATQPEFQSLEFAHIRHFNVPLLSDAELEQLEALAPRLHATLAVAPDELRELVRNPFNLRLLAELVSLNVQAAEIEPITTQLQLLDKYWQHRVLVDTGGDALEAVLRTACEQMLATRSMRIDRSTLQRDPTYGDPIHELLSRRVLMEQEQGEGVEREVLTFSHHVLFDYAVSRLLFRGVESTIVDKTLETPELLLIVRPSYELHFRHLWALAEDRSTFWALVIELARAAELPEIGKIIGPGVAALQIERRADFEPLLHSLQRQEDRRPAELALQHMIGARLAEGSAGDAIPDDRCSVWSELALALTNDLRAETVYPVARLLQELCARSERLTAEQLSNLGSAARNFSKWLRDSQIKDSRMLRFAIEALARTFASEPTESEQLLRDTLAPDRIHEYGFIEIPQLADEARRLMDMSPALARDIYIAAFGFNEQSEERTQISGGVLALSSTKRQDYNRAHRTLVDAFPEFMRNAPDEAIDALSAIQRASTRGNNGF
ncbi:hypothetical protein [Mycobacterium sp. MUNTM1]